MCSHCRSNVESFLFRHDKFAGIHIGVIRQLILGNFGDFCSVCCSKQRQYQILCRIEELIVIAGILEQIIQLLPCFCSALSQDINLSFQ